ncbi:MAG TPA: SCO family protein [Gammaproteobacteria bacterium]|nr:SCO family protein [Gammaproteobacteria bacterium]
MGTDRFTKAATVILWASFLLIILLSAWFIKEYRSQPALTAAVVYPAGGRELPDFRLRDFNQEVFDKRRFYGKWSFLFFGYTRCPDICPMTLQTLRWAADRIRLGGHDDTRFVFISVDPARDNPEYLKDYVSWFDAGFLGVSGEDAQLSILAKAIDAPYRKTAMKYAGQEGYLMDHSVMVYLINPRAELYAMLTPPHDAATIAADFDKIRAYYLKTQVADAQ